MVAITEITDEICSDCEHPFDDEEYHCQECGECIDLFCNVCGDCTCMCWCGEEEE